MMLLELAEAIKNALGAGHPERMAAGLLNDVPRGAAKNHPQ